MTPNSTKVQNGFFKKVEENNECVQCLQNLYLMVDGEASNDEEIFFTKHIDECISCFDSYNLEKSVKTFLQTRIEHKPVPASLISDIKNKIKQII